MLSSHLLPHFSLPLLCPNSAMFAESVSSTLSIWASLNSWFTPTVLFVVVNLVIGTIAIASNLGASHKPNHRHPSDSDHYFQRSPSVLQRLKSINPYSYRSEEPATVFEKPPGNQTHYASYEHPQLVRSPSMLQRFKFSFSGSKSEESLQSVNEKSSGIETHYASYEHPQLVRSPSILNRFKFNFSAYKSEESLQSPPAISEKTSGIETNYNSYEHPQLVRSPSMIQRLKFNFTGYKSEESFQSPTVVMSEKTSGIESHYNSYERPQLVRSPSMLQRLKFNFYGSKPEESLQSPPPSVHTVHKIKEVQIHREEAEDEEMDGDEEPTMDEIYSKLNGEHFTRTKSDTNPTAGEFPTKLPRKMKKSASSKSAFQHFEEDDIVESRRPATVKEGREKTTEIDDEVDARADDFINKFKQQLKLQRLESILNYKEMINRGGNAK